MSIQEREEHEYSAGLQTEHQNAYAWSRINREPDDSAKVEKIRRAGYHVLVCYSMDHCQITDACLGRRITFVRCGKNASQLHAYAAERYGDDPGDDEYGWEVLPPV